MIAFVLNPDPDPSTQKCMDPPPIANCSIPMGDGPGKLIVIVHCNVGIRIFEFNVMGLGV